MARPYIPTSEEIAAFVAKGGGLAKKMEEPALPVRPPVQKVVEREVYQQPKLLENVTEQVNKLTNEMQRRKRSSKDLQEAMFLLMEKYDFSPAEELVKYCVQKDTDGMFLIDKAYSGQPGMRIRILETLLEYTAPKLKSIEHSGSVEHEHTIHIIRYGDDGKVSKEPIKNAPMPVMEAEVLSG